MANQAPLAQSLELRSGTVLKNRICKASMNEALAAADGSVTGAFAPLYKAWGAGGAALLITGNVMVDQRHANEPLAVSVENEKNLALLQQWAKTAAANNVEIWPQLSHPGKQSPNFLNDAPVAPSAIPLASDMFVPPRELTGAEIQDIIARFIRTAEILAKAGFTGVQLHSAHGYLISQFLSPNHNQRNDQWGGSLENRMRFITEIYKGIRASLGKQFNISVKLNSSDFQKGGFTEEESIEVAKRLDSLGIDLLEISGGSWENPVNRRGEQKASTKAREAYFLDYAEKLRKEIEVPLMITGGFRSQSAMDEALKSGAIDVIGMARPFVVDPNFANKLLSGQNAISTVKPITTGIKKVDEMAIMEISWYTNQIHRISQGRQPATKVRGLLSVINVFYQFWRRGQKVKKVRA